MDAGQFYGWAGFSVALSCALYWKYSMKEESALELGGVFFVSFVLWPIIAFVMAARITLTCIGILLGGKT